MANRKKNRNGKQSNGQLLERARRELGKGNAKSALKDAKVAFRKEPTDEARRLLEAAYAGRVEQLHRQSMVNEAKAVLRELLDLKPGDPSVCERLPRLQVLVGDKDADAAALFQQQPELLIELTDRAVLDSKSVAPEHAGISQQVPAIQEALAAIEAGDDDRAGALLKDIPRTSPLSDWKLFARGLSAFYQADADRTAANWQRLDPNRPGHQIAQTLQAAAGNANEQAAAAVASRVRRLQTQLGRGRGFEQLTAMSESWRAGDWRTFFKDLRAFRHRFGPSHEATLMRIAELAWRRAVREDDGELFRRLTTDLPAPQLDPHWNRVRGLLAECSSDYNATEVETAWKAYARDVRDLPVLRDDERPVAEGLVYLRLGRKFIDFAEYDASMYAHDWDDDEFDEDSDLRKPAAQFLRRSIEACPRLADAYRDLAGLHEDLDEFDKAAVVYGKLIKQLPEDFASNIWLARYYLERDEPQAAEGFTATALRLKPRDPKCLSLGWTQQLTTVRCLAKRRKIDEARAELQKLREIRPPDVELFALDLIAAAIEFKAKDQEAAERFVDEAVARLEEPTAVWLHMSCTAARYSLPRDIKKVYDQRYKEAIDKKPSGQTLGWLASFFTSLKAYQINYTGRATQEKLALAALRRAKKVTWDERDLCQVIDWLATLPREGGLVEQLLEVGLDRFPQSPRLLFAAGSREMARGPFFCPIEYATKCFRTAIEANEHASLPLNSGQLDLAREALSRLEDLSDREPMFGLPDSFYDDEDDEEWGSDEGPLEFDGPFGGADDDELPSGFDFRAAIDAMPAELKRQLERAASLHGLSVEQLVMDAFGGQRLDEAEPPPKPRRRSSTPQFNQAELGFTDDE